MSFKLEIEKLYETDQDKIVLELQQNYYPDQGALGIFLTERHLENIVLQEPQIDAIIPKIKDNLTTLAFDSRKSIRLGNVYTTYPDYAFKKITKECFGNPELVSKRMEVGIHFYDAIINLKNRNWKLTGEYYNDNSENKHMIFLAAYSFTEIVESHK